MYRMLVNKIKIFLLILVSIYVSGNGEGMILTLGNIILSCLPHKHGRLVTEEL